MALKCLSVRRNLSAFLDEELGPRKREQVELHISKCPECQREMEKLRAMVSAINSAERPSVPGQLWEQTRRKIEAISEQPARTRIFRIPAWAAIPAAGAAILIILLYSLSGNLFYTKEEVEPVSVATVPITVCLEEHALSYSEQVLSSDLLPELAIVQTEQVAEEVESDEPMSELDMLVEVHYDFYYQTNGS